MSRKLWIKTLLLLLGLLFLLAACRRDEEEPTVTPEAPAGADTPTPEPTSRPVVIEPETAGPLTADWPPQLVYYSPAVGEEAMLDGAITLRFDQPMDQASFAGAFEVMDGEKAVDGALDWPRPDTAIFTPMGQLKRAQVYRVQVAESALGQNGRPLRQAVNLQVETVGFLRVSQTIPTDGSDEIQTGGAITVAFNRPVVPLVTTGQQANLPQPLSFEPQVSGQGSWISTSIYRFVPDSPLAGATTYRVTVESGLEDITGGLLADDFSWSFTTLRPSVVSTEPWPGMTDVSPTGPYSVTFNMPMDPASAESAISLAPDVGLSYRWDDEGQVVTLTPDNPLARGESYTLNIDSSARSAGGEATLDRDYEHSFTVVPAPGVRSTQPARGEVANMYQRGFAVFFRSPMDLDTLEGQIQIRPEPEDDPNYYIDNDNFNLFVEFELARNATYTITIPASAADPWGQTLGQDYTWSFDAPGYEPLVSLNLPNQPAISQLSTSFPTDVDVVYRNVSQVNARLTGAGLPISVLARGWFDDEYRPAGELLKEWSLPVELPRDESDASTLQLADGGVLPSGVYFLTASAPETTRDSMWWQNQRNLIVVAGTNLVVKQVFGAVYVWATDLAGGQPAAGLSLALYDHFGKEHGQATTDNSGLARFDFQQPESYMDNVLVVAGAPGEPGFGLANSGWANRVSPWEFGLPADTSQEPVRFAYLYTDRPIYRPGDTVHYKGIVRGTDYGRYPLPADETVNLSMMFFNDYTEIPYSYTATLDANGEFEGEYEIPEDAALGTYGLIFSMRDGYTERQFTVAEYRKPEFQVTITPEEPALLRGQATEVTVEVAYFFGGSASDLDVYWSIYADRFDLPWGGPPYAFGDWADFFYEPVMSPYRFGGNAYGQYLLSGQGVTDENGRLVIDLPADLLDEIDPGSRLVTVEAGVTDISNFPINSRTEVVFHAAETYVGVRAGDPIAAAGSETGVELVTVDWEGERVPDSDVEVVFYRRNWRPVRDAQFGSPFTYWEVEDTEEARIPVTTDDRGQAQATFVPQRGGSYIAVATVTDEGGRTLLSSTYLWVADASYAGWRSDPREKRMDLVTDQDEYAPGDVARILVQSPFPGPARAWLTVERGDIIEQRVITLQGTSDVLEIPITPFFAPNVFVGVTVVKGLDEGNPVPDIRMGLVELIVSPMQLALDVSLTPQQAELTPGDTAVYDIQVTDYQGDPVQASLSLALVDLAVLSLKPDNAPPILEHFYARQPMRSQTGSGLIQSGEGLEIEIPEPSPGLGGGGDGGAEFGSFALQGEEDEVRREFPDTAFWRASLLTNASGQATVEIPLPDSLTTWRLSSKAASLYEDSGETLVGQDSVDIVVTLPLLIRPVTPRFFVVGDSLSLGAVVHNNTGADQEVTVTLDADGLTLVDDAQQVIDIADGGRALIRWTATVDDVPAVDLTFRALAGDFRDATKPTLGLPPDMLIPAVRYAGEDFVGTAGVLGEAGQVVEAILLPETVDERQGEVAVQLNASLAAALVDALQVTDYTLGDAFRCAGAVTDELLPNVATATAVKSLDLDQPDLDELDRLIELGISRLVDLQLRSGAWAWCFSERPDPFLTAYALFGLAKAEGAGYEIPEGVISRAAGAVRRYLRDAATLNDFSRANAQAFYLYVLAEAGEAQVDEQDALFDEARGLLDPYARALLIQAYEISGGGAANQNSLLADLGGSAILSATGSHWEDAEADWDNLNSDIRGTAMVLDALAKVDPDSILAPNAVRWLMAARQASRWPTSHETAWSILALAGWMEASGELEADFGYQFLVNGQVVADGVFDEENVAQSDRQAVPVGDLILDDVNFLAFQRGDGDGRLYYTAHLDTFVRAEGVEAVNRGIIVSRAYYDAACDPQEMSCEPIDQASPGQQVRVELTIIAPNDLLYAIIEDPIPSGTEAIDPGLETTSGEMAAGFQQIDEENLYGYWGWWYFNRVEFRDEKVVFFSEFLPAGTYQYTYYLQPVIPGEFQVIPATARQEYFPEVFGRSDGFLFTIVE